MNDIELAHSQGAVLISEAARLLEVPDREVRRAFFKGEIEHVLINGARFIPLTAIDSYRRAKRKSGTF